MNDSLYTCAACLCVTLVACAVIRMIAPSGNTSRILSVVISVFVLCSMLSPITAFVKDFGFGIVDKSINDYEPDISAKYDAEVIRQTAEYINQYVDAALNAQGVTDSSIKTIVSVSENNGINVSEMYIYIDKAYNSRSEEIRDIVKNTVGVDPIVVEQ